MIRAIVSVAEQALGRMLTYLQVTHLIAKAPEKFPVAELICKQILAPGRRFPALILEESAPEVG